MTSIYLTAPLFTCGANCTYCLGLKNCVSRGCLCLRLPINESSCQDEGNLYWGIVMSKEKKSNKETKKPKAQAEESKKEKKDPKRHDGLGGK